MASYNWLSLSNDAYRDIQLKLSHEHQGFVFEPSLGKVPNMLEKHSRGKITMALKKAIELGSIK